MATTETLTVLVTDLVDSTAIASRLGPDDAEVFRRQHFTLLRRAVAAAGGSEVQGTGDGLLVLFPAAARALACAVDIQRRIDRANRRSAQPASVRIGLAAGDMARADGDHSGRGATGRPIAEAEALCAAAGGGHILASRPVHLLGRQRQELSWGDSVRIEGSASAVELRWSPFAPGEGSPVPLPEPLAAQRSIGFAGRAAERAKVSAAFEAVATGERQVVLFAGEPGIGKTRVAAECAHDLLAEGAVVGFGRCDEHLGQPFHVWVECLTHLVAHIPPELVAAHHDAHGGELARLVPLGPPGQPATPPARSADAETERYLLHAAVLDLLGRAAELGPVVLVLDDLHWADTPSLQLLVHLVRTGPAVLVVATFRDSDAEPNPAWADTLAVLHREPGVQQITLRGLDDVELESLLEDLAGHGLPEGAAVARALHQQTDGNPFFVRELLRHLVENGSITQGDDGAWVIAPGLALGGLPVSVREVLGRRVARLGPEVEQTLTVAAVLGREVDLGVLAEVLGEPAPAVLDRLDAAVTARLLVEVPTPIGRYRFAHALVQHGLYEGLGATRRGTWHRRVAEVLEARTGTDRSTPAAELARHWEGAYPPDPERAIRYDLLAGDHALELLAPADAMHWFGRALQQLDAAGAGGDTVTRATALVGLGEAQRELGDAAFRATLLDAAALAQRAGAAPVLVRAALANHRGFASSTGVVDAERVAVLEAALGRPGELPAAERARLLSQLATELIYTADWDRRLALADEALDSARRSGDPATVAEVLQARGNTLHHPSTLADRRSGSTEALGLATTLDDPALEFWCHIRCAVVAMESFDRDGVDAHLDAARAIAQRAGLPRLHWPLTWYEVTTAVLDGDLDAAERGLVRVLEVGRQTGQPDTSAIYGALALGVRDLQGRLGELVPLLEQVVAERPGVPGFRAELARAHLAQGERDRARELVAAETARAFAGPLNSSWLSGMVLWADAAARLEDTAAAAVVAQQLAPYHDQFVFNAVSSIGAVGTALGLLHTTLGQYDAAEAHLRTAANGLTRLRASSYLARNRLAAVRLLARRGAAGDAEAGRRAGEVLVALAAERGFVALEHDARGLLAVLAGEVAAPQGSVTAP